jgi:hypothetical protein
VIQYGAKITKWSLMQVWRIERADLQGSGSHAASDAKIGIQIPASHIATVNGDAKNDVTKAQEKPHAHVEHRQWRLSVVAALARVESLFADARKVYRFLQFLEMMEMFRNVHETARNVLMLRKLRIICFFFFYLLENYMVFLVRIEGFAARHPRVKLLKRSCNGFWCLSILLAFPLDHIMNRGSYLSTIKKILDLPVAYVAFSDQRVSDGIFGALGLASGSIGVYLRWIDVMAKWWPRPVHRTIQ